MGDLGELHALLPLPRDVTLQQLLREHAAPGQVLMVRLQSLQGLVQGRGQVVELGLLLVAEAVQVMS